MRASGGGQWSAHNPVHNLAWHIARRPGGLIALAIQYGHMRTIQDARTSSGYGSRTRRGIHSVLDVETALAAADTAAHLRDRVAADEKVSGPAARRALTAAATTPRFEGRIVPRTFAKKAAKFLARDGVVLYDNPDAFLICAFKHDNALCDPSRARQHRSSTTADQAVTPFAPTHTPASCDNEPKRSKSSPPAHPARSVSNFERTPTGSARWPPPTTTPPTPPRP
ncbi:hypothetical protein GCM10020367_70080 [Streptomyces sannanensis]|uniref:Uncharacterized protein n=1 Tax=Streptomyces sannanensis TaxID=285536 RepID=A0ABP6SNX3_9ACTN